MHIDKDATQCLYRVRKCIKAHMRYGNQLYGKILYTPRAYYYGLEKAETEAVENAIINASHNEERNEYPDFVYSDYGIEHFRVTSSKETRKGSEYKITDSRYSKGAVSAFNQASKFEINTLHNIVYYKEAVPFPDVSHDQLTNSFKKNWEKHIASFDKCKKQFDKTLFIVELSECALAENNEPVSNELAWYRLSRDKSLLEYIYKYKDKVDYVVFVIVGYVEIIKNSYIPQMISVLPSDLSFIEIPMSTSFMICSTVAESDFDERNKA